MSSTTTFTTTASSANKPPVKAKPYKRFLNSALHSRFAHALLLSLVLGWVNALLLGPWNGLFWSWIPLILAGVRTLLFFVTSLIIFFLQINTLTIGTRISKSPSAQSRSALLNWSTPITVVCYVGSALWFAFVYMWETPSLSWINAGNLKTPDRLNERPIYFRSFVIMLALSHALRHLLCNHSALRIPVSPTTTPHSKDQRTHAPQDRVTQLKQQAIPIIWRNLIITGSLAVAGPFIYTAFLRQFLWRIHLAIAKPFYNLSRSNARATGFPPLVNVIPRTLLLGMLLGLTWELTTFFFLTCFAEEPLKREKPLSDASKDANGTLLNGLKVKRDLIKSFAFWELSIIAQSLPERRKAIFNDIDRPTGPVWASMLEEALKVIRSVDERIEAGKPATLAELAGAEKTKTLPKLLPPPESLNVIGKAVVPKTKRSRMAGYVSLEAEKLGSSPNPFRNPLDKTINLIEASKYLPTSPFEQAITTIKTSGLGTFFAQTNAAEINCRVLGSPQGNPALIVDAIESITKMLVASMQDDSFGKAIRGVPSAVKQFTKTITLIETITKATPPNDGSTKDVEIIYERLKAGLTELLSAFQQFLFDTGLSVSELNDAKKASGQKGIEAAKEQQTPIAPVEVERQKRIVKVPREKEQNEVWRDWASPKTQRQEPRQPLFSQHTLTRKSSRGASGVGGTMRRREMEQVR